MGRLMLLLFVATAATMIVIFAMSMLENTHKALAAQDGHVGKGGLAMPTTVQKISYVALIVLLFGVCTGWLGGL